jgi:DNA polymerase (family 10)
MDLQTAERKAWQILDHLSPHCSRFEIAGSIRRRKAQVGDIEVVAIPNTQEADDLFADSAPDVRSPHFVAACFAHRVMGQIVKGDPQAGRYIQTRLPCGAQLDLFLATPANWGLILAIRTGSADFSHQVLARGWVRRGYHSQEGILVAADGSLVPTPEERDLFRVAGVPWVDPERRV